MFVAKSCSLVWTVIVCNGIWIMIDDLISQATVCSNIWIMIIDLSCYYRMFCSGIMIVELEPLFSHDCLNYVLLPSTVIPARLFELWIVAFIRYSRATVWSFTWTHIAARNSIYFGNPSFVAVANWNVVLLWKKAEFPCVCKFTSELTS